MSREQIALFVSGGVAALRALFDAAVATARAEPILSVVAAAGILLVVALLYGVKRRRRAAQTPAEIAPPPPVPDEELRETERLAAAEPAAAPPLAPVEVVEISPRLEEATGEGEEPHALALAGIEPAVVATEEETVSPVAQAPVVSVPAAPPTPMVAAPPAAAEPVPSEAARPLRLRDRLRRTSEALIGRLEQVLGGRKVDPSVLEDLEHVLYTADLGVSTAESLLAAVRKQAAGGDAATVRATLRAAILEKLRRVEPAAGGGLAAAARPHVILVLGVNGSGKTTTIGKLAARYVAAGKKVVLGAGDTFRAAAIEQLQAWGERAGCEVIAGKAGGDPSAVAFDTVKAAVARGADVAICDTAGRLQTKAPLVEELKKIVRVLGREVPGAPHESLLVLDSNTGQNAISQARVFVEAAQVTGLVLTKLDGTAKGGVLVGLADAFGIPVKYVGVGEGVGDLRDFSAAEFVDALFGTDAERGVEGR